MKRKISAVILSVLLIILAAGCGTDKGTPLSAFDSKHKNKSEQSFTAAENSEWSLQWDKEYYRILLKSKADGTTWSTLPEELLTPAFDEDGYEVNNNPQLENPLTVQYINPENMQPEVLYGYTGSLKKGAYGLEKISGGIKITYYFDNKQISLPVEYKLLENGINVSVDPTEITEGDNKVYSIALSPFFCSVSNGSSDGYLFVPSGSGALIKPYEWEADVGYTCSYPVYGEDGQLKNTNNSGITNSQPVRLPVYGAADGNRGVLAIIEKGAESASINCNVGNRKFGFSACYAGFEIRGVASDGSYSENAQVSAISVSFLPLTGEKASYSGMAEAYRNYLIKEYGIEKVSKETAASLELLGATQVDSQFLGIPYRSLYPMTTFKQALSILKDFTDRTGVAPAVKLSGFGLSGLNNGKAAGGLKTAAVLGSKKDIKAFTDYSSGISAGLYMNYNIVNFSKSGAGISKTFDYARNTVGQKALVRKRVLGSDKEEKVAEYFVAREKLCELGKKAADNAIETGIAGLSLAEAASGVYSDYSNQKYYARGGFATDYSGIIGYGKEKGNKILADGANLYAAVSADIITGAPDCSDKNDLFYADIPFYQMVFKGYIPMTGPAVNLAAESADRLLFAAETGMGLGFTFIGSYSSDLFSAEENIYHSVLYGTGSDDACKAVDGYLKYFEAVEGAVISEHSILSDTLRKTVFDNGVEVYINYGVTAAVTAAGTVEARSYIFTEGKR